MVDVIEFIHFVNLRRQFTGNGTSGTVTYWPKSYLMHSNGMSRRPCLRIILLYSTVLAVGLLLDESQRFVNVYEFFVLHT